LVTLKKKLKEQLNLLFIIDHYGEGVGGGWEGNLGVLIVSVWTDTILLTSNASNQFPSIFSLFITFWLLCSLIPQKHPSKINPTFFTDQKGDAILGFNALQPNSHQQPRFYSSRVRFCFRDKPCFCLTKNNSNILCHFFSKIYICS